MIRFKTLSTSLISAMVATTVLPATADLALTISSDKTYRTSKRGTAFLGGTFDVAVRDGNGTFTGGCARSNYWRANIPLDPCPLGSTGFLLYGRSEFDFLR
mgnify:FL=1